MAASDCPGTQEWLFKTPGLKGTDVHKYCGNVLDAHDADSTRAAKAAGKIDVDSIVKAAGKIKPAFTEDGQWTTTYDPAVVLAAPTLECNK